MVEETFNALNQTIQALEEATNEKLVSIFWSAAMIGGSAGFVVSLVLSLSTCSTVIYFSKSRKLRCWGRKERVSSCSASLVSVEIGTNSKPANRPTRLTNFHTLEQDEERPRQRKIGRDFPQLILEKSQRRPPPDNPPQSPSSPAQTPETEEESASSIRSSEDYLSMGGLICPQRNETPNLTVLEMKLMFERLLAEATTSPDSSPGEEIPGGQLLGDKPKALTLSATEGRRTTDATRKGSFYSEQPMKKRGARPSQSNNNGGQDGDGSRSYDDPYMQPIPATKAPTLGVQTNRGYANTSFIKDATPAMFKNRALPPRPVVDQAEEPQYEQVRGLRK